MSQPHICVVSAMWRRPRLVEIMLDNLAGLREQLDDRLRLSLVMAGSEGASSRELVRARSFGYVEVPNRPLGKKWMAALEKARELAPDSVLVLGSDNLVNAELLRAWAAFLELGYDYVGLLDAYQYNPRFRTLIHWPGYRKQKGQKINREGEPIGSGRMVSARLLSAMKWRLWDEGANRGLDYSTTQRLKGPRHQRFLVTQRDGAARHLGIKVKEGMSPSLHRHQTSSPLDVELLRDWYGPAIGDRVLSL